MIWIEYLNCGPWAPSWKWALRREVRMGVRDGKR